ncbi:hypothetical protein D9M69_690260 [compost metagenome]
MLADKLLRQAHGLELEFILAEHAQHTLGIFRFIGGLEPAEHVEQAVLGSIDDDRGPP